MFTLVELLVVIAILGILAGVVVFAVGGIKDKGQDNACKIDKRTLQTAEEAYSSQNSGNYANQKDKAGTDPLVTGNELVTGGFISEAPMYHYVKADNTPLAGAPKTYSITAVAPCTS